MSESRHDKVRLKTGRNSERQSANRMCDCHSTAIVIYHGEAGRWELKLGRERSRNRRPEKPHERIVAYAETGQTRVGGSYSLQSLSR